MTSELLTAEQLAPMIGFTCKSGKVIVGRWKNEGRIPAAVDEPNFVRYDLAEVRAALKERAERKAADR